MSKYGDDLRKITRTKELEDKLKEIADRLPIPGQRGIGYSTDDGKTTSAQSASGTAGSSTAPVSGNAATSTPTSVDENGTPIESNNPPEPGEPSSEIGDEASSDIEDLLDGNTDKIGDQLSELTGLKDCNTGKDVTVRLDGKGLFRGPSDGSWLEGSSPPLDTTWFSGKEVEDTSTGEKFSTGQGWYDRFSPDIIEPSPYTDWRLLLEPLFQVTWYIWSDDAGGAARDAGIVGCTPGSNATCLLNQPLVKQWTLSDGTPLGSYQVSLGSDGQFRTSPYDSQAPKDFKPTSSLTLCFGAGASRQMKIESNNIGGKTLYEVNTDSGRPTGLARVYSKTGVLIDKGATGVTNLKYKP